MLTLYNLLFSAAVVLYLPVLFLKKGPESRRTFITERLGLSRYSKTDIWVHAVSVGEALACIPFLKKLKKEFPDKKIAVTTTTYTGQKIAKDKFPEADRIMYIPLDSALCVNSVVGKLRPEVFICIETELWPVLFHALKKTGSKVVVLNGRISDKSFQGYSKIKFLMKRLFADIDFLYMQGEVDADRILKLGADKDKVDIMGNFKFDMEFSKEVPLDWLNSAGGRIMLAASTHRGEDGIIIDAFKLIRNDVRDVKLIIAPRHPERFDEVADLIKQKGLDYIRRSQMQESGVRSQELRETYNGPWTTEYDIILLDTMGELSRVYSHVYAAFIGGSLIPHGGQNLLEPAYWSKPIIFGPHMENFPIAGEFLEKSAAMEVKDANDIAEKVTELMNNEEKAAALGRNAKAIVDKNTGAVKKAIELIRGYIGTA